MFQEKIPIKTEMWKNWLQNKEITNEKTLTILTYILHSASGKASVKDIAEDLGYPSAIPLMSAIGNFTGRIIDRYPDIRAWVEHLQKLGWASINWHIPFLGEMEGSEFFWILRPELKKALEELGL